MIAAAMFVIAQAFPGTQRIEIPDWDNAVKFEIVASQSPVRPGDSFEIALVAEIEPGYHLYGPEETPPSRTVVSLVGDSLQAGKTIYPPVIRRDLSGLGEYDLYEGRVAIRVPVTVPKSQSAGEVEASIHVAYQICTDFACSAPASDDLSLRIAAGKSGSAVKSLYPEIFKKK